MAIKKLDTHSTDASRSVTVKSDPTRIDPLKLKLGKQTPRRDPRTLMFASYTTPALPAPPASLNLAAKVKVPWGMMDNAQIGDCTCAAAGHLIMEWTANAQAKIFTPSDQQIVDAYSAITGYNPVTGANDNGAVELDVLNYWRQNGIAGHKIQAFVALEASNHTHIMDGLWIFGGCYIGLSLPKTAQAQTQNHRRWRTRLLGRTRRPCGCLRLPQSHRRHLGGSAIHDLGFLGGLLR